MVQKNHFLFQAMGVYLFGEFIISLDKQQLKIATKSITNTIFKFCVWRAERAVRDRGSVTFLCASGFFLLLFLSNLQSHLGGGGHLSLLVVPSTDHRWLCQSLPSFLSFQTGVDL